MWLDWQPVQKNNMWIIKKTSTQKVGGKYEKYIVLMIFFHTAH